jgi:hypothetical protein
MDVRELKSGVRDVNDLNGLAGQGMPPKVGLESWRPANFPRESFIFPGADGRWLLPSAGFAAMAADATGAPRGA